jgi:hypothetical protein
MNIKITLFVLIIYSSFVFAQDYKSVNVRILNVREQAGKKYKVVAQIKKGDKVIVISEINDWSEIETEHGAKGFVNTKYLEKTKVEESLKQVSSNKPIEPAPTEVGFKYGFKLAFKKLFFIAFIIFAGFTYFKSKRIKDGRYNSGYKIIPFSMFELIKFAAISAAICSVLGLFIGTFFWIKAFFI